MYNKQVLSEALANLQKRKAQLTQPKDIIVDPMGQYNHPGKNTRIPGGDITMANVPYPVMAYPNIGQPQIMYPEQEYNFPGADYVDEYPIMQIGGQRPILYVDPNDPEGVARYEAYQDSLNLHNLHKGHIESLRNTPNTLSGFDSWMTRVYKPVFWESQELKNRLYNLNNEWPKPENTYQHPSATIAGGVRSATEYKKPVQQVKYGPNLNTDLAAWLKTQGAPASYADRKKLYEQVTGQTDYKGTSEQNIGLLNLVKEKGLDYNINDLEKVPSNTSDKTAFVKSLSKMPERSEESVETPITPLPIKEEPTVIRRQVPKTTWKQLPNGTWYPVTRAGNNASVEDTGVDIGGRTLKYDGGSIDLELTDDEIEQYKQGGYIVEEYSDGGIFGKSYNEKGPFINTDIGYDSRYSGIKAGAYFGKSFRDKDLGQHSVSGGLYGTKDGLGVAGRWDFKNPQGSLFRNKPYYASSQVNAGFDKTRGVYADGEAGLDFRLIDNKKTKATIGPRGVAYINLPMSSTNLIDNPNFTNVNFKEGIKPLANIYDVGSLTYGLQGNFQKDTGLGRFKASAGVYFDPVKGKRKEEQAILDDDKTITYTTTAGQDVTVPVNTEKLKFTPEFRGSVSWSPNLRTASQRKVARKIAEDKKEQERNKPRIGFKKGGYIIEELPKAQVGLNKRLTPQELIAAQRAQRMGTPQLFNFDSTPEYVGYNGPQPAVAESTSRANNNYVPTKKEIQEAIDYSNYLGKSAKNIQQRTGVSFAEAKKNAEALLQLQAQPQAEIRELDLEGKDKDKVFLTKARDAQSFGDYANLLKGVITNPIDAATAFMSPGGFSNNFYVNQGKVEDLMRDGLLDYDKVQSNPMMNVVSMLPYALHGFGQLAATKDLFEGASAMYRNPTAENAAWLGLDYAGAKLGVSPASNRLLRMQGRRALDQASDYLTTQTPLRNTYKLNPFAFKPNPEAYYRGIGKEGMEDALQSGVFRPKNAAATKKEFTTESGEVFNFGKSFDKTYYSPDFKIADRYGKGFIAEVPQNSAAFNRRYANKDWSYHTKSQIPIDQGRILQKDWLKGYKEIPKPTSSVDDVGRGLTNTRQPWQMQELPGLHLKSTMEGEAISKIVEPKTGLINTEQALAIIGKESSGADKVALIRQGLGDNIPRKMDYNDFRKVVQDQLIPLERQFANHSSDYGINRLGLKSKLSEMDYKKQIDYYDSQIEQMSKYKDEGFQKELKRFQKEKQDFINSQPLENQTLILGNKSKFGRGSSAHNNPEETLGHVHFLRDAEHPNIGIATQIQSDAFQGTHRTSLKTKEQAKFSYDRQLEHFNKNKEKIEGIKKLDDNTYQFPDGQKISKGAYDNMFSGLEESLALSKADLENFTQKQLLDKNHQERFLQEFMDYAGKRGDLDYIAIPKPETAAKVQGYSKGNPSTEFINSQTKLRQEIVDVLEKHGENSTEFKTLSDKYNKLLKDNSIEDYLPEHKTILKKYIEYEKMAKKLGWKTEDITIKGNTYTKIQIPDKFKKGKGEIKAFNFITPVIGAGAATYLANPWSTQEGLQFQNGGVVRELTDDQIEWYKSQGYNVEEL